MGTPADEPTGQGRRSACTVSPSHSRSRSAASPSRSTNGTPASPTAAAAATRATTRGLAAAACRRRASISRPRNPISPGCRSKVGRTYRLPSESEREYFTRAGTTTPFWFGNTISAAGRQLSRRRSPMAVGRAGGQQRTRGGRFLRAEPVRALSGARQRLGMDRGLLQQALQRGHAERRLALARGRLHKRMVRGGTWDWSADVVRAGARDDADVRFSTKSFRVVRTLNVPVQ